MVVVVLSCNPAKEVENTPVPIFFFLDNALAHHPFSQNPLSNAAYVAKILVE